MVECIFCGNVNGKKISNSMSDKGICVSCLKRLKQNLEDWG